jgi:hypothetical protein
MATFENIWRPETALRKEQMQFEKCRSGKKYISKFKYKQSVCSDFFLVRKHIADCDGIQIWGCGVE